MLTRDDFDTQFLRWVVVIDQDFSITDDIETLRLFQCLNSYVKLSSFSTIKNHIMKRVKDIKSSLFEHLSHFVKISFTLNCWSASNRQSYLFIIAFFIDKNWKYHEVIIDFEYMKKRHTNENLTKMMKNILKKHKIEARILVIIIDNVFNNITFFYCLMKSISSISNCVDVSSKNDEKKKTDENEKTFNVVHVFCLTHVLQLTLQTFLDFVRVNSINDQLQKNWNEQKNVNVIKQANIDLSMTLAKIDNAFNSSLTNFLSRINLYTNSIHKYAKSVSILTLAKTEKKAFSRFNLQS